MAVDPEARELKISRQFLTHQNHESETWPSSFTPSDSVFGFGSAFTSPVDSEIGSVEIESDKEDDGEDDYTAELTRRMAQYMLQDDDNPAVTAVSSEKQSKSWGSSGSPISTLWSPLGSSMGSPEGPSMEPSPPTTPVLAGGGLDISHSVISKLEKMNVCSDAKSIPNQIKIQKRKQRQFMKQQRSSAMAASSSNSGTNQKPVFASGSSGTGVFLPRHVYHRQTPGPAPAPPSQKKKGCSPVLIPVRVLQALQLHYDKMDPERRPKVAAFPLRGETAAVGGGNGGSAAGLGRSQADMGLPQEWTY